MNDKMDLRISGASVMPGGDYHRVSISGSGKIKGNVRADLFRCSGAAEVEGDVETGELSCSGACKLKGNIRAQEIEISGALKVQGGVWSENMHGAGGLKIGTSLHGSQIRVAGGLSVGENVEAEKLHVSGEIRIPGLLNAEEIVLQISGKSQIGEIGCSEIKVKQEHSGKLLFGFINKPSAVLEVEIIEGDRIELAATHAKIVRGADVVLEPDCRVERVEYTGTLTAQEGTVGEAVKI